MKQFLKSDTFTRVLSFVLALLLWAYIAIFLNPDIEITISDVPVFYSESESLTSNGLIVTSEKQRSVNLRLKGARSTLSKVNNKNITAIVDMNGYNIVGEHFIPIAIKLPVDGVAVSGKSQENVIVAIDKFITIKKAVQLNVVGTPTQGYVVDSPSLSQDVVTISGPEMAIKTIDKVGVTLDVANLSSDIVQMQNVILTSANDVAVENEHIQISPAQLEARCALLEKKTVPVSAALTGTNIHGYKVTATIPAYSEINIIGYKAGLGAIVSILTEHIDITNIAENKTVEIGLALPPGIKTAPPIDNISVQLTVEAVE